jgi:hypothetical protein
MANQDFNFTMDLFKSDNATDEDRLIRGLASAENMDAHGEVVLQSGADVKPLLQTGWVNWDHNPGAENLIGIPLRAEIADISSHPIMNKSGLKGLGMYVEARLLQGHPRADAVWSLLKSLKGTERTLAWSIQGGTLERTGASNNMLARTVIRHIAITHQPVNQASFAEVVKSLSTTSAAPMRLENLDAGITPSDRYKDLIYGDCLDAHFSKSGNFRHGVQSLIEHLIDCKGESLEASKAFVAGLIKIDNTFRSKLQNVN